MLVSFIILIIMIVLLVKRRSKAAAILTVVWAAVYSAVFGYGLSVGGEAAPQMYSQLVLVWIMFVIAVIFAIARKGE